MSGFENMILGFSICLQFENLLYCFVGVFIGTLVGVLPGIGPIGAMSILLPVTFKLSPIGSVIMLAGIYYGAMYGGSTTSILVNIPGETASVITCLDGHQMALQGRAGPALSIAAFGSFFAGTFSILLLSAVAPPLAKIAYAFGPPEYTSLMIMGLVLIIYLAHGSMVKALMMASIGLLLSYIGLDSISGYARFTFQTITLQDGIGLVPVAMGTFGLGEVLTNIETAIKDRKIIKTKLSELLPTKKDWKDSTIPLIRGTLLGFFLGILPGGGPILASFASYSIEKRFSKNPEKFGKGAIEGVAGPEAANNAGAGGAFIPLMAIGIPSTPQMALLLGALVIYGFQPGPLLLSRHPDFFWAVVTSMYVGNVMLLILNLPLIGMWVQVLRVPYPILFPLILLFTVIGCYSLSYNKFDVLLAVIFGVIGYFLKKTRFEAAPMLLGMVLGPMLEDNFRQSLMMSRGDFSIFFTRPISGFFAAFAILVLIAPVIGTIRGKVRLAEKLPEE